MSDFDRAFDLVIGAEGGYVNDPRDPGGETKFGISKRAYPLEDIAGLTLERAKAIYKRDYWDAVKGDELPFPLNAAVFDCAVNQGVKPAVRVLQRAMNVADDGIIGPLTLRKAAVGGIELLALYQADRALRYVSTKNFNTYGRGWFKRLFKLLLEV